MVEQEYQASIVLAAKTYGAADRGDAPMEAFITQVITSVAGNLPATPIGVGEVVTAPMDVAIPIPVAAGAAMKITGEVRYKLVSIDKDPDGSRIARFEVTTQGALVTDSSAPSPVPGLQGMKMDMKISGFGTTLRDLDKGTVKASETKTTMTGSVQSDGGGLPIPPMTFEGFHYPDDQSSGLTLRTEFGVRSFVAAVAECPGGLRSRPTADAPHLV